MSDSLLEIVVFGRFLQLPPSSNSMSNDIDHGLEYEENLSISSHISPTSMIIQNMCPIAHWK
jgi:hypothetical protein